MLSNPNGACLVTGVPEPPAANLYARFLSTYPVQNRAL